ncbi:hypothetical protein ABUI44_17880, partial [Acinetobacter baumannii]
VELGVQQFKWNGSKGQLRMLQHGQVHSSFDNAFAHCCAIIKISGGEFAGDILKLLNKPTEEVEEEKPSENDVEKAQTTEPVIESETTDSEYQKKLTHKRLEELEKSKSQANEPPSLMVQIQNAPDLTTLDALEIDVAARDPLIQPKLMGYIRKRRYELENPAPTQSEAEPDYLLGDNF